MFTAASFIKATQRKRLKRPLADEEVNKLWCVHMTGCYLTIKKNNRLLMHAPPYMDLENINAK